MVETLRCPSCGRKDRIVNVQEIQQEHRYRVGFSAEFGTLTYGKAEVSDTVYDSNVFECQACGWSCDADDADRMLIVTLDPHASSG